jgi:hypothetical protein
MLWAVMRVRDGGQCPQLLPALASCVVATVLLAATCGTASRPDGMYEAQVGTEKAHFAQNPGTFANLDVNPNSATPLRLPVDEAEVFLR